MAVGRKNFTKKEKRKSELTGDNEGDEKLKTPIITHKVFFGGIVRVNCATFREFQSVSFLVIV